MVELYVWQCNCMYLYEMESENAIYAIPCHPSSLNSTTLISLPYVLSPPTAPPSSALHTSHSNILPSSRLLARIWKSMDIDTDTKLPRTLRRSLHEIRCHRRTRQPIAARIHQIRAREGESLFNAARRNTGMWKVERQCAGRRLCLALRVDSLLAVDQMRGADAA
jgi:hypothetical protein